MEQDSEWMSLAEAAVVLKVGVPTIEDLIAGGRLDVDTRGADPRIARAALMAFLRDDQRRLMGERVDQGDAAPLADDDLV